MAKWYVVGLFDDEWDDSKAETPAGLPSNCGGCPPTTVRQAIHADPKEWDPVGPAVRADGNKPRRFGVLETPYDKRHSVAEIHDWLRKPDTEQQKFLIECSERYLLTLVK